MEGIGPVRSVNSIYLSPVYGAETGYVARNLMNGIQRSASDSSAVNAEGKIYDDINTRNLKKAGLVECETCKRRRYQDVSNDPCVSFKAPGYISPQNSAAVVMSHEQEHVFNENARASIVTVIYPFRVI
jgi:hypothetical protein